MSRRILFVWTMLATLVVGGGSARLWMHHRLPLAGVFAANLSLFAAAGFLGVRESRRLLTTAAVVCSGAAAALVLQLTVGWLRRGRFVPSTKAAAMSLVLLDLLALAGALAGGALALLTRRRAADLPPS
jgi:hypothetical protein